MTVTEDHLRELEDCARMMGRLTNSICRNGDGHYAGPAKTLRRRLNALAFKMQESFLEREERATAELSRLQSSGNDISLLADLTEEEF